MQDDIFYTRHEIAAAWKCSLRTVDRMIAERLIAVHRIGRSVRIKGSDAITAAALRRQEASAA